MVQAILGVNKKISKLSLSYYSLSSQIIIINLLTTIIGLIFLLLFNYFIFTNNNDIENKNQEIDSQLNNITNYLQNNAIIRIPQFNEKNCEQNNIEDNVDCGEIILSNHPQLDPTASQNYLFNKYIDQKNNIKIYDVSWIKYADTDDFYLSSDIVEIDIKKQRFNYRFNFFQAYKKNYLSYFNKLQNYFNKQKIHENIGTFKGEISLVIETIKNQKYISKIKRENNNLYLIKSNPIIVNNNIHGVVLVTGNLFDENIDEALISFNLLNLFLILIFFMFLFSFFFLKSIINPIKLLSNNVIFEKDKTNKINSDLKYPQRNDEIGTLSKEIKNMFKDLKLKINELENFTADVSHELKNPIASLKSSNDLLLNEKIEQNKKNILIKNMKKDIERMNILISDISNYTRTQIEIEDELFSNFNLVELIKDLIESFSVNEKNIQIIFEYEKNPIMIKANKDKLARVFINLIENSITFSPINSKVLIKQNIEKNYVTVLVVDQGIGIKQNIKEKIFNRFYTDRSTSLEQHSGLGLSISKKIIESFFGTISVEDYSRNGYNGACFKLKLPLKE